MTEKKDTRVTIAIPTTGWVHVVLLQALMDVFINTRDGTILRLECTNTKPIDSARNLIVKRFLENGDDYLVMIDSDNPPRRNPVELVDEDKDIIVCPTPMWDEKIHQRGVGAVPLILNTYSDSQYDDKWIRYQPKSLDIHEIGAGGTGCIVIARRVLEKIRPAFKRTWDEDGVMKKGSDLYFCQRARRAGFDVWIAPQYLCSHFKEIDLVSVYQTLAWRDIQFAEQDDKNTSEYWDEQWAKREERLIQPYEHIVECVREEAQKNGGVKILDFGCGRGDLLNLLEKIPGAHAEGMDYSEVAVEKCRTRGLHAELGSEPSGYYDLIVSTEVLEHIDDDVGLIRKMLEHAKRVMISVPNNCLPPGLEPEHRRVYTRDRLIHRAKEAGAELERVYVYEDYLLVKLLAKQTASPDKEDDDGWIDSRSTVRRVHGKVHD